MLGDPVGGVNPWGLEALNNLSNFFAGFGDAVTIGLTEEFRKIYNYNDVVNRCSQAYIFGNWTFLGLGSTRLLYAGTAKVISILTFPTPKVPNN